MRRKIVDRGGQEPVRFVRGEVEAALVVAGVQPGDGLVVGCSNGPDSLVLADAVIAVRPRLRLGPVTLAYVDHGLRPEVVAEAAAVRAFAAAAGEGVSARVQPVTLDRQRGGGLEEAARAARHQALESTRAEVGARFVLLGHTASDQSETVLGRLLRGAGPVGLAGIPPVRGKLVRPLLRLERATVEAYVAARGLRPSEDASNSDLAFLRNRVRHRLLPALREENPAVDAALVRTAGAMLEMREALEWAVDRALREVRQAPTTVELGVATSGTSVATTVELGVATSGTSGHGGGSRAAPQRLACAALAGLPAAVAKRLLARSATELGASLEARHLEALLELVRRPAEGTVSLDLPRLAVRREYETLVLAPGTGGARREASVAEPGPANLGRGPSGVAPGVGCGPSGVGSGHAGVAQRPAGGAVSVAVDGPGGPFTVRSWQAGDRMRPRGLGGRSRKLQDLFVDRKVPAALRRRAVVVMGGGGEILWAEHVGPAHGAVVTVTLGGPATRRSEESVVTPGSLDEPSASGYQIGDARPNDVGEQLDRGKGRTSR